MPGAGGFPDVVSELVADESAAIGLAEQVDDDHVVRAEHVDNGLIAQATHAPLRRLVLHAFGDVGPQRHELDGERAPDQPLAGIEDLPVARELIRESPWTLRRRRPLR